MPLDQQRVQPDQLLVPLDQLLVQPDQQRVPLDQQLVQPYQLPVQPCQLMVLLHHQRLLILQRPYRRQMCFRLQCNRT